MVLVIFKNHTTAVHELHYLLHAGSQITVDACIDTLAVATAEVSSTFT